MKRTSKNNDLSIQETDYWVLVGKGDEQGLLSYEIVQDIPSWLASSSSENLDVDSSQ